MIVYLLLTIIIIILTISVIIMNAKLNLYTSDKKILSLTDDNKIEIKKKSLNILGYSFDNNQTVNDLAFRVALTLGAGNITMWDYDVSKQHFEYLIKGENSKYDGYSLEEYLLAVHPEDRNLVQKAMDDILSCTVDKWDSVYRMLTPSGGFCWFKIVAMVHSRFEDGTPRTISGLRWDVTEDIEEKQNLIESKAILSMTFNAGKIVPWTFDAKTMKMSSYSASSLFFNEQYGLFEYIDIFIHPDHKDFFRDQANRVLEGLQDSIDFRVQAVYDNKYEWIHIVGCSIFNSKNKFVKFLGTSQFVTAEVKRQEEMELLRQKAEESNKLKSAFLANMSHEIRTPLNSIVGFSNLLAEMSDTEEAKEFAAIIQSNNDLLLRLIGDILDISRIEAGKMEFVYSEVDICAELQDIHQTYIYKMSNENVNFVCEIPDQSLIITTEKNRFMQVLCNFLNNSIKYTSTGTITFGYQHIDNGLKFFVRDTGKGIDKDNIDHVFERFSKFDDFVPGTGLGLSICKTIVQKLNGEVGVESELGKGSEFWFTIPIVTKNS